MDDPGRGQNQGWTVGDPGVLVDDDAVAAGAAVLTGVVLAGRVADGQVRALDKRLDLQAFALQEVIDFLFGAVSCN